MSDPTPIPPLDPAAVEAGFLWLAVIGILNSVLGLGVYLRLVVPMYRAPASGDAVEKHPMLAHMAILIAVLVTLFMGLFAGILPGA